ncbi:MAG TPA: hypothetical protein VGN16_12685 [Acidobacteriaceae bacterium]|jgi:hypothetical protein
MSRAPQTAKPAENLSTALAAILLHPWRNLVGLWNWKAASLSALLRAATFLATNLRAGSHKAVRAMLVEAVFAILAAGTLGAVTQRLRATRPFAATALTVWLGLPILLVAAQTVVHRLAGTPHLRTGLIVSFCFAAVASGFTWYTVRRGVMLAGRETTPLAADARALPQVIFDFLLAGPRALFHLSREA